ncbi:hypothetical protein POKO110462_22710 [Pontibacter korlensis]
MISILISLLLNLVNLGANTQANNTTSNKSTSTEETQTITTFGGATTWTDISE